MAGALAHPLLRHVEILEINQTVWLLLILDDLNPNRRSPRRTPHPTQSTKGPQKVPDLQL